MIRDYGFVQHRRLMLLNWPSGQASSATGGTRKFRRRTETAGPARCADDRDGPGIEKAVEVSDAHGAEEASREPPRYNACACNV